jgi:hypothetical protein
MRDIKEKDSEMNGSKNSSNLIWSEILHEYNFYLLLLFPNVQMHQHRARGHIHPLKSIYMLDVWNCQGVKDKAACLFMIMVMTVMMTMIIMMMIIVSISANFSRLMSSSGK